MKILLPFDQHASSERAIGLLEAYRGEKTSTKPVLLNVQSTRTNCTSPVPVMLVAASA